MTLDLPRIRFYRQATEPTGGAPAATTETTTDPPAADNAALNASNAARRLLEKAQKEAADAKAETARLQAELKTRQDADLSETERLKKENDELKPFRDEHGRFKAALESDFQRELEAIPEEKRENILALVGDGTPDARLRALRAASALLAPAPAETRPPVQGGTRTQPAGGQAPTVGERISAGLKSGDPLGVIRAARDGQYNRT